MKESMDFKEIVERSIITKYRKEIWRKFISGVNEYDLIKEGDKIAVCISGGKDSMLLAKCMQELQKHGKIQFEVVYLCMDPGYSERNRNIIIENSKLLGIPLTMFESNIFDVIADVEDSPCYLCARMRRGCLYGKAQELGCNKIALGHHFDDAIETIMMSMLYNGQIKTMMPKLHSTNFDGMELIRPLYLVKEADIIHWKNHHELKFIACACRMTESFVIGDQGGGSKRNEMKQLIKEFRLNSDIIDKNIFKSVHNINLDTIIGYEKGGVKHSFLDEYDENK